MKKKENKSSNILLVLVFLAGLSLLLYPSVSNFVNTRHQSRVIADYRQELDAGDAEAHAKMMAAARDYNASLLNRENEFTLDPIQQRQYEALLNVSGNGVMGYVEIPCIDVILPVCHTTDETVLQTAAGHVEWSSLPVGGESSHSIISGHRGLPTAELMTHIDRLRVGDRFYMNVLGERLEYQVDQIKVVLPENTDFLQIEDGQDYMTLVTCTPYGINSHRLLVRGARVLDGKITTDRLLLTNEVEEVSLIYVLPVSLLALVLLVAVILGVKHLLRRKK